MWLILLILLGIICVCIALWKYYDLEIVQVSGDSMTPTLQHNQLVLLRKRLSLPLDLQIGAEYSFFSPSGVPAIKRLWEVGQVQESTVLWFEGDNKEVSLDSRSYGYVNSTQLDGKVIFYLGMRKRRRLKLRGGNNYERDK